jgi:hypothetical protein
MAWRRHGAARRHIADGQQWYPTATIDRHLQLFEQTRVKQRADFLF